MYICYILSKSIRSIYIVGQWTASPSWEQDWKWRKWRIYSLSVSTCAHKDRNETLLLS